MSKNAKLCSGQATKDVLVGRSTEHARAYWNGKIANEWDIGNKTCPDIIKLKHVRNGKNVMVCRNQNKILCVVRQVLQSANCVPTR